MSITAFSFGEWLPDLPDLGNPGLIEALNVLPIDGLQPFYPLTPAAAGNGTLPAIPIGAISLDGGAGTQAVYAATATRIYLASNPGAAWLAASATLTSATACKFAVLDTLIVATNGVDVPQGADPVTSSATLTALATSGTAPVAKEVGTINQFVVLGNLNPVTVGDRASIQWSAIANGRNWPTPNSATAIATQSGRQDLDWALGDVTGIVSGDQHGLILQQGGVTRMTYAGPPVVFQFDQIENQRGCFFPRSPVSVKGVTFFASTDGFYACDGVKVVGIGDGKVDRYFRSTVDYDFPLSVWSALDSNNNLIYWGYAGTGHTGGRPNMILVYNYEKNRWTHANQQHYALVTSPPSIAQSSFWSFPLNRLLAFDANSIISFFAGAAGTATLISGEVEPQPGGCALVNGIKAIVSSSGTAPSIAVQVGSRDDQAAAVSYSATTAPTSRTGFSDFRSDARFHRARVYIAGNFDKALGLEIDATPTGGM